MTDSNRPAGRALRFRDELRDFRQFVRQPVPGPRLPGRAAGNAVWVDWIPGVSFGRLLKWALLLWATNLFLLGPLAVVAAGAGGATHRLSLDALPWLHALLWAPLVEEMAFRFGLRRLRLLWWALPLSVTAMFLGPQAISVALLGLAILPVCIPARPAARLARATPWAWRRAWRQLFPVLFHGSSVAFAALHLYNFNLHHTPWWLLPLLVLPQWFTGMVLGWLRVRRGIGAAVLLHGLFNAGPLLVVWLVLRTMPDLAGM